MSCGVTIDRWLATQQAAQGPRWVERGGHQGTEAPKTHAKFASTSLESPVYHHHTNHSKKRKVVCLALPSVLGGLRQVISSARHGGPTGRPATSSWYGQAAPSASKRGPHAATSSANVRMALKVGQRSKMRTLFRWKVLSEQVSIQSKLQRSRKKKIPSSFTVLHISIWLISNIPVFAAKSNSNSN